MYWDLKWDIFINNDIILQREIFISVNPHSENKGVQASAHPSESKLLPDESLKLKEKNLVRVVERLGSNWWQVGVFLGVKFIEIEIIKHDFPFDTIEQSFQMLLKWYTHCNPEECTFKILREALETVECFDALGCLLEGIST
ncbi:p53-induced death domain-containing protein 1-like [Octopus bimaculoides]|uniref:p53-induced death domain-containing protein 1-like n=1 Tax=Octopus bimaculoides TaxID=37653 RepID=UPI0022E706A6|nr:p53-induced death domain-containing protein 1-like [Octopus bimaculoides]